MIKGFLINKFRGNPRLFDDGVSAIESRTGWPCLGVVRWLRSPALLPAEDAVSLQTPHAPMQGSLKIVAPMFSRIANFDDADPLRMQPGVEFDWVPPGKPIPRDADLIVLFGTKSTLGDLSFLRQQGWDHDILAHARAGGRVLGICGSAPGLGLLDVHTVMTKAKQVQPVTAECAHTGLPINGYEIHAGDTEGADTERPFAIVGGRPDGATSTCGRVQGTYLHGAFAADAFRAAWLERAGGEIDSNAFAYDAAVDRALDELADEVSAAVDIDALFKLAAPSAAMIRHA